MEEKKGTRMERGARRMRESREEGGGWKSGTVGRNRCREGFRRRQYFNRRQIYRPPGHPTIRNGRRARYVPLREVISCLSRGHLACLSGQRLRSVCSLSCVVTCESHLLAAHPFTSTTDFNGSQFRFDLLALITAGFCGY